MDDGAAQVRRRTTSDRGYSQAAAGPRAKRVGNGGTAVDCTNRFTGARVISPPFSGDKSSYGQPQTHSATKSRADYCGPAAGSIAGPG